MMTHMYIIFIVTFHVLTCITQALNRLSLNTTVFFFFFLSSNLVVISQCLNVVHVIWDWIIRPKLSVNRIKTERI